MKKKEMLEQMMDEINDLKNQSSYLVDMVTQIYIQREIDMGRLDPSDFEEYEEEDLEEEVHYAC